MNLVEKYKIIISYINETIQDHKDVLKNKEELDKLHQWLNAYHEVLTPDFYEYLIKNSSVIQKMIKELITNKDFIFTLNDTFVCSLVKAYCLVYQVSMTKNSHENCEKVASYELLRQNLQRSSLDNLRIYLNELNANLLTLEEEKELGYRILKGDRDAKNQLIEHNLRWVVNIAKRFTGKGVELEDLIQAGNEGLLDAVEQYDVTKGTRFTTYAEFWITQKIRRVIGNTSRSIRLPVHVHDLLNRYKRKKAKLELIKGKEVLDEEMARELKVSVAKIRELKQLEQQPISMNSLVGEDSNAELESLIPDSSYDIETELIDKERLSKLKDLIAHCDFTKKEQQVLLLRYGTDKPKRYTDIGKMFHVTGESIRQIESRALRKIRLCKKADDLSIYMDSPEECLKRLQDYRKEYYIHPFSRKKMIKNTKHAGKPLKTIYDSFSDVKQLIVDQAILRLPEEYRQIIQLKYGDDLKHPVRSERYTKTMDNRFYAKVVPAMKDAITEIILETEIMSNIDVSRKRKNQ